MADCDVLVNQVADEVVKRLLPILRGELSASPEYLTIRETAALTGFSYDFVYDAVTRGDLRASQKGRTWRVKAADARAWMDRDRGGPPLPTRPKVSRLLR